MPTLEQSYADLQAILGGPPPTQTIDLVAAAAGCPSLAALTRALALLRSPSSLTVTAAALTRERDRALLIGAASVTLGGSGAAATAVDVALTLTEPTAGTVVFSLALTVPQAGWTFGSTFAALPQTLRAAATGPGVAFGPSALRDLVVATPTFTASSAPEAKLQMTGALQPSGELLGYRDWVGPWPLELTGTAGLPATSLEPPLLALRATSSQGTLGVPPVVLRRPGFALICAAEPNPEDFLPLAFSELQLVGSAELGGETPIVARLSGTMLVSNRVWRLLTNFDGNGPSLLGGLAQLAGLFGLDAGDLRTPPALGGFESFRLDEVEVWLTGDGVGAPTGLSSIAATIRSEEIWQPPIPFLSVSGVGTRWALTHTQLGSEARTALGGSVFGSLLFANGEHADPGIIDLTALLPSFVVMGAQRADTSINVSAAFQQLFGRSGPALPGNPYVTEMRLMADPFRQIFQASAAIELDFPVPGFAGLSVSQLSFEVSARASSLAAGLEGRLRLGRPGAAELFARAELPDREDGGWVFSGGLVEGVPLTLGDVLELVHLNAPDLLALTIGRLEGTVDTLGPWSLAGAIGVAWRPTILGVQVAIAAGMELELAQTGPVGHQSPATGWVAGELSVNRLLVRMRRDLGVAEPTYALRVQFGELWLQAATAWRAGSGGERHQVIALQLGGVTLGDVLEELVNLAAPTLGFQLDAPWDVLKRIELSRFTLTVDPTARTIELTYAVNQDLLVMRVDTVGVRYALGDSAAVELIVTGRLLDREYTTEPLSWDVINDPPPAIPGQGAKLIELRYLGLGQRVRLPDPQPETVAEAIGALRRDMHEPPPSGDPLAGSAMVFDSSSEVLAALDLRVLETVEVALVFNDPRLYGLSVALDGERAGALAGLRFEILYKRLPSGVGMFRTELRVPEQFRRIELGEVSIGLGTIVVEVYTNGDFLVHLGFPHNREFTRSFDVQVFPFLGRGGIYFGVLSGATSRRVPAIGNGTFSPVLELGVGLAVGVGKEISAGPLSGGAYVELEVIFEGVLAWFHPTAQEQPTELYYRAQGIVAIHGKVYATADFVVVKASVTLEAYAQASVVLEAYRATVFGLYVLVEAEAEIEILFLTTSFSFSVELDLSFTVGSDRPPPWIVSAAQPPRLATRRAPRQLAALQRERALHAAAQAGGAKEQASGTEAQWTWQPDFAAFPSPRTIDLSLLPAFSVEHPPVSWTSTPPPEPAAPAWQVAFPLFARNGVSPHARTARDAQAPAHDTSDPVAAASLLEALLRWSLSGLPTGVSEAGKVTAGELALLGEELAREYVAREQFTRERLATFFATNLHLRISGDTRQSEAEGAMVFPAPPWIAIAGGPGGSHDLFTTNPIGPAYAAGASAYMAGFAPVAAASAATQPDVPAQYESFAARVFCDSCLMIAREAVRQAVASLENTTVAMAATLDASASALPTDLVHHRVRPGETIQSLAGALGAGVAELEALNPTLAEQLAAAAPGDVLAVIVGVAGCTLAADNATRQLAATATVTLRDIQVQVRSQDSLNTISTRLYTTAQPAQLVTDGRLAEHRRLLRAGAPVAVAQRPNPLTGTVSAELLAAAMYVRSFAPTDVPHADWYAQAIAGAPANTGILRPLEPGEPLPTGSTLAVPTAYAGAVSGTYTTQAGDTLLGIGATLSLEQAPAAYPPQAWSDFLAAVRASQGRTVPATAVAILPGESLGMLAARLLFSLDALVQLLAAQPVLDPLAVIELDVLALSAARQTTLAAMAQVAGLTVEQLARRPEITAANGLFAADTALTVKHLPAQTVAALVTAVCGGAALSAVSSQVSRTLLGGIRLPAPETDSHGVTTATGPLSGVLKLTGQQLDAPAQGTTGLTVTVSHSAPAQSWITFANTPGGPSVETLTFGYTSAELATRYPAGALTRPAHSGPTAIPVAGQVPRTYTLEERVDLQVARPLPIPGADPSRPAGMATLWRLPAALLDKARAGSITPFDILRACHDGASPAHHDVIQDATFATLVAVRIRRVASSEHVYELLGAEPGGELLLRELAAMIATAPATRLSLAMAPAPGAGAPPVGLTVFDASPSATFVLRANMATDLQLAAPPAIVSANLGDGEKFVKLLWEASLAQSGYHLGFATVDGADLPVGAFDGDGMARLWLLAIRPDAQQPAPDGRTLHPIDTCALAAAGLDSSAHSLYVEAHGIEEQPNNYPDELVTQALVPAGSAGVTLTVARGQGADPAGRLAQLFSLLVTEIEGSAFSALTMGPAAPPQREDGQHAPRWVRERQQRSARVRALAAAADPPVDFWRYDQVVPLYRYASVASPAPDVPGLPAPATDPYRGFGAGAGLATARFRLGYADVLGNITEEPFGATVNVPAGYTDPLLGPAAWPGATTAFALARAGDVVTLTVSVTAQPANAVAGRLDAPRTAADAAARQADRYAEVALQLAQPTVHGKLLTTLCLGSDGEPAELALSEGVAPLWRFAAAAHLASGAAAMLVQAPVTGLATLAEVSAHYGIPLTTLGAANAGTPFTQLAAGGQPVAVLARLAVLEGDSAASLLARVPRGWPAPASAAELLELQANAALALRVGTVLATPEKPLPLGAAAPQRTLASVAAENHTTPAQLAIDSKALAILRSGFAFQAGGQTVAADGAAIKSLTDVQAAFSALAVDVAVSELAAAAAERTGLFADNATLSQSHFVAAAGDTLASLAGTQLAAAAASQPNLWAAGTLVTLGSVSPAPTVPAEALETLGEFAERHGATAALVLADNPTLRFASAAAPILPGACVLPSDQAQLLRVPYSVAAGDTLGALGGLFATTARAIAAANANMPGLLSVGRVVSVTVGGSPASTTTLAGDTLTAVVRRLAQQVPAVDLDAVADAIATDGAILAGGGLLVMPPAALATRSGPQPPALKLADVVGSYGVDGLAFAQMNMALCGVLAPGVVLQAPGGARQTTAPVDTLNAVLGRFAEAGVNVELGVLLASNAAAALFPAGAHALLPPAPASVSAPIGDGTGPFPQPVFPLSVLLRLERDDAVVLIEDPAVQRADTAVPAPAAPSGEGALAPQTLDRFAAAFEAALPGLRLGTARVAGESADLWVVDFTAHGIASVVVQPAVVEHPGDTVKCPRFLALRPLYPALQSRSGVPVPVLDEHGAITETTEPLDFQGVDVEGWARQLLADVRPVRVRAVRGGDARQLSVERGARAASEGEVDAGAGSGTRPCAGAGGRRFRRGHGPHERDRGPDARARRGPVRGVRLRGDRPVRRDGQLRLHRPEPPPAPGAPGRQRTATGGDAAGGCGHAARPAGILPHDRGHPARRNKLSRGSRDDRAGPAAQRRDLDRPARVHI